MILEPILENFPPSLVKLPQRWGAWKAEWSSHKQKWEKVPQISTKMQWLDLDQAVKRYQDLGPSEAGGVGFLMTGLTGLTAIDLDRCVKDGVPLPWAQEVIELFDSYTELSPSGMGIRIFAKGDAGKEWQTGKVERGGEVYCGLSAHFVTVTGHRIGGRHDVR